MYLYCGYLALLGYLYRPGLCLLEYLVHLDHLEGQNRGQPFLPLEESTKGKEECADIRDREINTSTHDEIEADGRTRSERCKLCYKEDELAKIS